MTAEESFHLEEYKSLRAEILCLLRQSYIFEGTVFLAIGAIYSWLFSDPDRSRYEAIWWLPFVIAALGFVREAGIRMRLLQISEYVQLIEDDFSSSSTGGWEHYLNSIRKASPAILLGLSSVFIWSTIIVVTLLVALGWFR